MQDTSFGWPSKLKENPDFLEELDEVEHGLNLYEAQMRKMDEVMKMAIKKCLELICEANPRSAHKIFLGSLQASLLERDYFLGNKKLDPRVVTQIENLSI